MRGERRRVRVEFERRSVLVASSAPVSWVVSTSPFDWGDSLLSVEGCQNVLSDSDVCSGLVLAASRRGLRSGKTGGAVRIGGRRARGSEALVGPSMFGLLDWTVLSVV